MFWWLWLRANEKLTFCGSENENIAALSPNYVDSFKSFLQQKPIGLRRRYNNYKSRGGLIEALLANFLVIRDSLCSQNVKCQFMLSGLFFISVIMILRSLLAGRWCFSSIKSWTVGPDVDLFDLLSTSRRWHQRCHCRRWNSGVLAGVPGEGGPGGQRGGRRWDWEILPENHTAADGLRRGPQLLSEWWRRALADTDQPGALWPTFPSGGSLNSERHLFGLLSSRTLLLVGFQPAFPASPNGPAAQPRWKSCLGADRAGWGSARLGESRLPPAALASQAAAFCSKPQPSAVLGGAGGHAQAHLSPWLQPSYPALSLSSLHTGSATAVASRGQS